MHQKKNTIQKTLLILGIIFIAFNLRPAITAVGPLIPTIRADLQISNAVAGFITTLPLLSFALLSPLAPTISRRLGNERTIFLGLVLLVSGIGIRFFGAQEALFIGTALIGLGVAICNVLLPSIVKNRYPTKIGTVTSVYSTAMGIFAALASGASIPLAISLDLGWRTTLTVWGVLAMIAIAIWTPQLKMKNPIVRGHEQDNEKQVGTLFRSKLAWQVTLFMGLQSFLFYCTITWLPDIFHSQGIDMATAGLLLAVMQFAGLPASFFIPIIADKLRNQRAIVGFFGMLYGLGLLGLFFSHSLFIAIGTTLLIGFAQGACISLSLTLLSLRAHHASEAASLSAMAQSIGYLLAALGPIFIGTIFDRTATWSAPLVVFLMITVFMTLAGLGAGRNEYVTKRGT